MQHKTPYCNKVLEAGVHTRGHTKVVVGHSPSMTTHSVFGEPLCLSWNQKQTADVGEQKAACQLAGGRGPESGFLQVFLDVHMHKKITQVKATSNCAQEFESSSQPVC